jgi:hypothetical protein
MTATVLPNLDRHTIEELRKRFPDLSEIELPKLEGVGKTADETIDRLLGRSRPSVWPWIAASIGLVALISAIGAYFAWFRRSSLPTPPVEDAWTVEPSVVDAVPGTDEV